MVRGKQLAWGSEAWFRVRFRSVPVGTQNGRPLLWFERGGITSPCHPHSADTPPTASLPVSSPGRESGSWQDQGTWWLSCGHLWALHWPVGALCFSWGDSFALSQKMLFHEQRMLRQGSGTLKIASGPPGSGSFPEQPLLRVITLKAWGAGLGTCVLQNAGEIPSGPPHWPCQPLAHFLLCWRGCSDLTKLR